MEPTAKNKTTERNNKVRLTPKAYQHLNAIVNALRDQGQAVTQKSYLSSQILATPIPIEKGVTQNE
jgi:hypothetical protein